MCLVIGPSFSSYKIKEGKKKKSKSPVVAGNNYYL